MLALLASFWMALIVAWAVTPRIARLAVRFQAIAIPRHRDMHETPTPRWGGAAIALAVLLAAACAITLRHLVTHGASGWTLDMAGVFLATAIACLWGMLDDRWELSALAQIAGILIACAILVAFGVRIDGISHPMVAQRGAAYNPAGWLQLSLPISILMTIAWTGLVAKTVDAMDGLDGLAGGICAISAATLTFIGADSKVPEGPTIALVGAAIVGACLGFLRFNTSPARIFMGSSGGLFLGVMLAALSMLGSFKIATAWSLVIGVLVLGVPIFDYFVVLARRWKEKAPLSGGDRRHLHHRLLDRGLSKRDVVLVIYCCTAMLCSLAIALLKLGN
jgi:UDP-GlcNAc:undecaprenyl-phosphate GlcNAc-1-phosphate transferase